MLLLITEAMKLIDWLILILNLSFFNSQLRIGSIWLILSNLFVYHSIILVLLDKLIIVNHFIYLIVIWIRPNNLLLQALKQL